MYAGFQSASGSVRIRFAAMAARRARRLGVRFQPGGLASRSTMTSWPGKASRRLDLEFFFEPFERRSKFQAPPALCRTTQAKKEVPINSRKPDALGGHISVKCVRICVTYHTKPVLRTAMEVCKVKTRVEKKEIREIDQHRSVVMLEDISGGNVSVAEDVFDRSLFPVISGERANGAFDRVALVCQEGNAQHVPADNIR